MGCFVRDVPCARLKAPLSGELLLSQWCRGRGCRAVSQCAVRLRLTRGLTWSWSSWSQGGKGGKRTKGRGQGGVCAVCSVQDSQLPFPVASCCKAPLMYNTRSLSNIFWGVAVAWVAVAADACGVSLRAGESCGCGCGCGACACARVRAACRVASCGGGSFAYRLASR
eukprot:scaffold1415_cov117-Isochrysis_galbana.AAC.9